MSYFLSAVHFISSRPHRGQRRELRWDVALHPHRKAWRNKAGLESPRPSRRLRWVHISCRLNVLLEVQEQTLEEIALVPQLDDIIRHLVPLLGLHLLALDNLFGRQPTILLEAVVDPVSQGGFPVYQVVGCSRVAVAGLPDVECLVFGGNGVAFCV